MLISVGIESRTLRNDSTGTNFNVPSRFELLFHVDEAPGKDRLELTALWFMRVMVPRPGEAETAAEITCNRGCALILSGTIGSNTTAIVHGPSCFLGRIGSTFAPIFRITFVTPVGNLSRLGESCDPSFKAIILGS
jgi:hypothetical protein